MINSKKGDRPKPLQSIAVPDISPLAIGKIGLEQGLKLHSLAISGDKSAANELVDLAVLTTQLVERLYGDRPDLVKETAKHRRLFPTLYSWHKQSHERGKSMLNDLPLGENLPFKTIGVKQDSLYQFIVDIFHPHFSGVQSGYLTLGTSEEFRNLETRIKSLPPLSNESCPAWADLMTEYSMISNGGDLSDSDTWLHNFANPNRAIHRKKTRATKRLDSKYHEPELSEIAATWQQERTKTIAHKVATPADLKNGLREAINVRLQSILKK